jgi:hypothetical protein
VVAGMALMLAGRGLFQPNAEKPMAPQVRAPDARASLPPWGSLKEKTLLLERPDEVLSRYTTSRLEWHFANATPGQVSELLASAGLTRAQLDALRNPSLWEVSATNVILRPPLAVVGSMEVEPRRRLYELLARTPQNLAQRFPYVFRGDFSEWMAGARLPAGLIEQVRKTIYQKGDVSIFADLPYFQIVAGTNDALELGRIVSRTPTVLLGLEVNDYTDLHDLRRYWLTEPGGADFHPLLSSMSRVPGGTIVGVSTLLPPFAQLLLNSYPRPRSDFPDSPNCVWSSMNFFNARPDNRFVEERYTDQVLQTQYHSVPKANALGDIIMLYRPAPGPGMEMVHMCVFIANDVVFTKNGGDVFQPWVLMKVADVQALFVNEPVLKTAVFRRNHRS